ncbi:MAG: hypothetical protein RR058_00250 [Oscillospiraceae bacterium]
MFKKKNNGTAINKDESIASPDEQQSKFDPSGSYTGVPENKYEKPVQDADDL